MPSIVITKHCSVCAKNKKIFGFVGFILLLVSPLWFLGAGVLYKGSCEKLETWTRTEARVVDHIADHDSDGTAYYSLFRFTAANGKSYDVRANYGSNRPTHELGETVPMLYPQEKPSEAVEESFLSLYMLPLGLAVFGVFDFVFGCIALHIYRRREPEAEVAETVGELSA